MRVLSNSGIFCVLFVSALYASDGHAQQSRLNCGSPYTVVRGDTLTHISIRSYGSPLYQPIYAANIETIGSNPDLILIGQLLAIPCLETTKANEVIEENKTSEHDNTANAVSDSLTLVFNKASAPPFILNTGIIDKYLAEITQVTEGRVRFTDPETVNRDHSEQFELVTTGQVDGAYVLNTTIAGSHPLLQLPMLPMFGGSAEQTAISLWRLHETFLSKTDYFSEAQLLGFIAAPAAHIWRDRSMPITATEDIAMKNEYHVPYFHGLDTRGPAAMRAEFQEWSEAQRTQSNEPPALFMAHGAATALGIWNEGSTISVMEVDNGLYTPTFSVILSNDAWEKISLRDQEAILEVSGHALSSRSAAWDEFDNAFRERMLNIGLDFQKADKALLDDLWKNSRGQLKQWSANLESYGISGTAAVNFYITGLRALEDRLIYRGEETYVDQHPFVTGENFPD